MIKYYRETKPLCGSQLDITHPLAPNAACFLYNEGNGIRLNNLALPLPATNPNTGIAATWKGEGYFYSPVANNIHKTSPSPMFHNTQKMSWAFGFTPAGFTSVNLTMMCGQYASYTNWAWLSQTSAGKLSCSIAAAGADVGNNYVITTNVVLAIGRKEKVVITYDGTNSVAANRIKIYISGNPVAITMGGTIPTSIKSISNYSYIKFGELDSTFQKGNHILDYYYQWYNRVLTPLEAKQISAQPYQFIVQDWIDYPFYQQALAGGVIVPWHLFPQNTLGQGVA